MTARPAGRRITRTLSLAAALALSASMVVAATADAQPAASHQQVGTITIPLGDQKVAIHSFCVDSAGNLLATCGGEKMSYVRGDNGYEMKMIAEPSGIRVISPEGKLLATWALDVTPQAVNVGPDGTVYCGGQGRMAKLDRNGKVLKTADSPQTSELPPLPAIPEKKEPKEETEEARKAKQARIADLKKLRTEALAEFREISKERRAKKDDKDALAQIDASYAKALAAYRKIYEQIRALTTDPQTLAKQRRYAAMRKRAVTGIAVTATDLFVACPATKGYGYDVWRMDLDLGSPKKIVTGLRGCCGQMDIQAAGGKLFVAENARKRVRVYDRDGKELASWGSGDRESVEAFGSCCNPMNLRFGPKGELYTSEASLGRIKRFSPDGKFLGVIGTATIVPGCKHAPIGVSKDGARVYLLDITRAHIVVMARQ